MEDITSIFKNLDAFYSEFAKESGLSETAFYIMMAVYSEPAGYTQSDVCERWALSRQTVNSALKKLEKENYLRLTPADFGKKKIISFTEKGSKYAQDYIEHIFQFEKNAWEGLSEEKQTLFLELATEYYQSFKEAIERFCQKG